MKLSKILLLSLGMALCVGGGVTAALALTREGHEFDGGQNGFDKAICLYWGEGQSEVDLPDMDTLQVGQTAYNYLAVSPKKTVSVAGKVNVNFVLTKVDADGKTGVLDGISIEVFETASLANDETVAALIDGKQAVASLSKADTEETVEITISKDTTEVSPKYYAIKVSLANASIGSNEKVSANLSISQEFVAAAANA